MGYVFFPFFLSLLLLSDTFFVCEREENSLLIITQASFQRVSSPYLRRRSQVSLRICRGWVPGSACRGVQAAWLRLLARRLRVRCSRGRMGGQTLSVCSCGVVFSFYWQRGLWPFCGLWSSARRRVGGKYKGLIW